jgi:disulfide bond formation protein DsbB
VYSRIPGVATKGRSNPWTKLIIVLVLVVVIFVALSIYAEHLVHNQHNSSSAAATWTTSAALPVPASGITNLRL